MYQTPNRRAVSEYDTEPERIVATKDTATLLRIRPVGTQVARAYLDAALDQDAPREVKQHFAAELNRQ